MKRILFFLCVSLWFVSCGEDPTITQTKELYKYVNNWVYQNMDQLYYWNTSLPTSRSTSDNPNDYFKTLIYKDDRFSAIFENYQTILNELNGVSSSEIGFDFQLYRESYNNENVYGILYLKPGTPAASSGIKRGDIFRRINGTQITMTNYRTVTNYLSDNSTSSSITFSIFQNGTFIDQTAMKVNKVANYQENPIYLDTVYTVQNKKIGYLVYNFFANDTGNKSMQYDLELNNTIGKFKAENITELIVDLRYNHGGAMSSATNLASMLVPNLTANKVFTYTEFNQNYTNYFNSSDFKSKYSDNPFVNNFATTIDATYPTTQSFPIQNIGNNFQRIFFLTTGNTASASEMVINGLKPFLPCILVGDTTVGKNVGSTLVNDQTNAKNQWAMLPIILKYFNKDHQSDFTKGFVPDFRVEEDYLYPLGDIRDVMLGKAITQISGLQVSTQKSAPLKHRIWKSAFDFKPERSVMIIKNKATDSYLNWKKEQSL